MINTDALPYNFWIKYDGVDITEYFAPMEVTGRSISENEIQAVSIATMDGAHFRRKRKPAKPIQVKGIMTYDSAEQLRTKIDELNNVLNKEQPAPLEFSDEPGRAYWAILSDVSEGEEIDGNHIFTMTFFRADPYKYGAEQSATFTDDTVTATNNGTAESYPTLEFTANKDITHLDVVRDDGEYMRIGNPARADQPTFRRMTQILHDTCATTVGWTTATAVDNGYIAGSMISDGTAFVADSFGTPVEPYSWQGPSIKKSFSESLTNFRMDVMIENMNEAALTGMIEIYLLDASNNVVMKMGLEDVWQSTKRMQGKMQLGPDDENRHQYYRQPDWPHGWNNYDGVLRLYRDDFSGEQRIRPYFAKIQPDGTHVWVSSQYFYKDAASQYQTPITQIQIAIRKWPVIQAEDGSWVNWDYYGADTTMRIKDIKVWKFNTQQGIPYIASPGDTITLDHANEDIRINGESRKDLKDFGASYFSLPPGYTTIYQYPQDSVSTTVKWRDRYL